MDSKRLPKEILRRRINLIERLGKMCSVTCLNKQDPGGLESPICNVQHLQSSNGWPRERLNHKMEKWRSKDFSHYIYTYVCWLSVGFIHYSPFLFLSPSHSCHSKMASADTAEIPLVVDMKLDDIAASLDSIETPDAIRIAQEPDEEKNILQKRRR